MYKQVVEQASLKPARTVLAAFLLTLLICLGMTFRQFHRTDFADFQVYDAAAEVVHEGKSIHMYDDADTGSRFELKFVNPALPLAQAANHIGIDRVRLYIYPPILADILVPLTFVPAIVAARLWLAFNLLALVVTALLLARMLQVPLLSLPSAALVIGALLLFSTGMALLWGQITILLLLLWAFGMLAYQRGWLAASAAAFALATLIKLTPLLVVVPFFFWREWRWLRAYVVSLLVLVGLVCLINTPASLTDYFVHVIPSMSGGGTPDLENKSLLSSMQLLYVGLHGGVVKHVVIPTPPALVSAAKAAAFALLLVALALVARLGKGMSFTDRRMTLALFALLSVCVAPISWKHAYVVALFPLALLWADAFRKQVTTPALLLLTFCSVELGSFFFDSVAVKLTHGPLLGILAFLAPGTGIALSLVLLARMRPHMHPNMHPDGRAG